MRNIWDNTTNGVQSPDLGMGDCGLAADYTFSGGSLRSRWWSRRRATPTQQAAVAGTMTMTMVGWEWG
jgi:hypothetical protein